MIFVSYSWRDRQTAELLLRLFEEQAIPHWIDSKQLDLTRPLRSQIQAALLRASVVAYLDTSTSRDSKWVRFELSQARAWSIPIVAIASPQLLGADIFWQSGRFYPT